MIGFEGHTGESVIQFPGDDATFLTADVTDLSKIPRSLYWSQLVSRLGGNDTVAQRLEGLVGVTGKNMYPAPMARLFAMAEVFQANEASHWPDVTTEKRTGDGEVEEGKGGGEYGVAKEVGGQNATGKASVPGCVDHAVADTAAEASGQTSAGETSGPEHVDHQVVDSIKEASDQQNKTGEASEPEQFEHQATEYAKRIFQSDRVTDPQRSSPNTL